MEQSQKHFSVLEKEHNYVSTVLNINHITFLHTVQILTTKCYFSESKVGVIKVQKIYMVLHRLALYYIYSTKLHTFCIFTVDNFHFTNKVSLFKTILSTNWSRNRNRCSFAVRLAQNHESIKKKYTPFCEPSPTAHLSQYILCNRTYPFTVYPLQQNLCCITFRVKYTVFCIRRSEKDFS